MVFTKSLNEIKNNVFKHPSCPNWPYAIGRLVLKGKLGSCRIEVNNA